MGQEHSLLDKTHESPWLRSVIVNAAHNYCALNTDKVIRNLKRLESQVKATPQDHARGLIETAICQCLNQLAYHLTDVLRFSECYELCSDIQNILLRKADRYRGGNRTPPPDNAAWSGLIRGLAENKWKAPVDQADLVMSLDEMIYRHTRAQVEMREKLIAGFVPDAEKSCIYLLNLAWDGTALLCAVLRFARSRYAGLHDTINGWHAGLFEDESQPFYWKLNICKELFANKPDSRQVLHCLRMQTDTMIRNGHAGPVPDSYLQAQTTEQTYLLELIRIRKKGLYLYQSS